MSPDAADPRLNVVVQASAGAGKTYLLTTRILRLLLAGHSPGGILAITFTRKAAAEIQARVSERLWALACLEGEALDLALGGLGLEGIDDLLRRRARNLYEDLQRHPTPLRATTFHAFCQDLLRRFPLEADVPPGFTLNEETGALADEAWEALIDQATRQPDSPPARALESLITLTGGLHNAKTALFGLLERRIDWWAYRGEEDDATARERLLRELAEELEINPADDHDPAEALLHPAVDEDMIRYCELLGAHANATQRRSLEHLQHALAADHPPHREAAMRLAVFTKQDKPRKLKLSQTLINKIGTEGAEALHLLHQRLCERLLKVQEHRFRQFSHQRHRAWLEAGLALLDHHTRIKSERRLLDFDDLEWRAYRLLNGGDDNALWVQYKLDQRIEHILVDEFQDTNPTQWRLLLPLLEEMAAGGGEGRSVFLVGDVKQSIYAFRRAQPALMTKAADWLSHHLGAKTCPLDKSWRSSPAVIEVVNRVFSQHPHAGHMNFRPHDTHHQDLYGRVTCLPLVDQDPEEEDPPPPPSPALRNPLEHPRSPGPPPRALLEGRRIAETLRDLLDAPLVIGQGAEARPLRPGDIMILLRRRTHAHHLERALREAGIPYLGTRRGTLLHCREVEDLVDLIQCLNTPFDDLALAAVLRSPLFAASDEDLHDLADEPGETWMARLLQLGPRRPPDTPLHRAAALLPRWRVLVGHLPVHDLLDRIYHEGDVAERFERAFPEHLQPRVRGNLQRLLDLALTIDSGRYPSLGRFLERLHYWREEADAEEAPDESTELPDDDQGRVRLLTIHAAKGLEAPLVVLADSASPERNQDAYTTLVDWPPAAPRPRALRLIVPSGEQDQVGKRHLEALHRERAQEDANLLYVAMTRARQILLVSGHRSRRQGNGEHTWYDLITQALGEDGTLEHGRPPSAPPPGEPPSPPPAMPDHLRHCATPPAEVSDTAPSPSHTAAEDYDGEEATALTRGSAIHLLLEHYHHEDRPTLLARLAAHTRRPPDDPELRDWFAEVQRLYHDPALAPYLQPPPDYTVYDEAPLQYRNEQGRRVQGIVDRLMVGPDEVIVLDYKTHREARPDNLAQLAEPYRAQLTHYCAAARRLWPDKKVRGVLLFTRPGLIYELEDSGKG